MTILTTETPLGAWVAARPELAALFDQWGLDYCCGGGQPLAHACAARGLDSQTLMAQIAQAAPAPVSEPDSEAPLDVWVEHIVSTHHQYLNRVLPEISLLLARTRRAHEAAHPALAKLQDTFEALRADLEAHLAKEETVLFPYCQALQHAHTLPVFHCGSIENPIRVMRDEHDLAGSLLRTIRALSDDFAPPADACATYRATLTQLAALEADLHRHIHKENNVLFPKAQARAAALLAAPGV